MKVNISDLELINAKYQRITELDANIALLDDAAKLLIEQKASVNLDLSVTRAKTEAEKENELQQPPHLQPIYLHGTGIIPGYFQPDPNQPVISKINLPEGLTMSIIDLIIGRHKAEKDGILIEIDRIIKKNAGFQSQAQNLLNTGLQQPSSRRERKALSKLPV